MCYNVCNYLLQCTLYQPDRKVHLCSEQYTWKSPENLTLQVKAQKWFRGHLYITFFINFQLLLLKDILTITWTCTACPHGLFILRTLVHCDWSTQQTCRLFLLTHYCSLTFSVLLLHTVYPFKLNLAFCCFSLALTTTSGLTWLDSFIKSPLQLAFGTVFVFFKRSSNLPIYTAHHLHLPLLNCSPIPEAKESQLNRCTSNTRAAEDTWSRALAAKQGLCELSQLNIAHYDHKL